MPDTTENAARDAAFTRCRTIGHAWFEADSDWKSDLGTPWTLRCERCGTERREVIARNGRLMYRRYVHAEGYLRHWDEPMNKEAFRVALLALRLREARREKRNGADLRAVK